MRKIFLEGKDLLKEYGVTVAVNHLDIKVYKGEILALVGANGAGKSTLTKIISGVVKSSAGSIIIDGQPVNLNRYSTAEARKKGIRVVHQELSLCKNLTVYENFYIEQPQKFSRSDITWRKKAREMAKLALDTVFPQNNIDVNSALSALSIAQQQMVEIARATCDPEAKMLILDEPTSSLSAKQAEQLQNYIKTSAKESGTAYIYISHRLKEIMYLADYVFIMQNGKAKYQCPISETNEDDMVARMGNGEIIQAQAFTAPAVNPSIEVSFQSYSSKKLRNITSEMHGGEIIGITGLEGNGQLELLRDIFFHAGKKDKSGLSISGRVAFVAGDRKKEGIFPIWSIRDNTIISQIAGSRFFSPISAGNIDDVAEKWNGRLKTKYASSEDLITSLSGGNQQKVLIARAFAANADIILLDDPTRGVDVETKMELYQVFREAAMDGKLIIWRTSDDGELVYCTRLLVMNNFSIGGELSSEGFSHTAMLKIAFHNSEKSKAEAAAARASKPTGLYMFSLAAMLILYVICGLLSPAIFSKFGIELLAVGFAPFIFAALSQTFIIGLSHIDLGVGAFMGLINVICATVLDQNTGLGLLVLALTILGYSCMGIVIYWRNLPPIIVTLGMSFIWTGVAYELQNIPGGHVPEWMVNLFNFNNPLLQGILFWLLLFILISVFIYRSRYGTVLRGFGNNTTALRNSGWSECRAYWLTYLLAGIFAAMGGIAQSSITGASDVNASSTYTMLTVAAVIIGGGYFSGGVVTHAGAVFGGISLTMVSILLGLLKVSTDFTATIQGFILILILSLRLLRQNAPLAHFTGYLAVRKGRKQ